MQFIHQSLTWGFLLALIPLAIHLINLVRRRRVQWAAMDFLLQSYRKHRTWIWLQQLLLLLLRMGAVALLVAMLAQWVTQREWFALFGGTATHHFVLIDDSYSMAERSSGTAAFDLAEQALGNIASQAGEQETRQKMTVMRFSKAAASGDAFVSDGIADMSGEIIDAGFDVRIAEVRRQLQVTELAAQPHDALKVTKQLLADGEDENNVLYILSDFRDREWSNPAELRQLLADISAAGGEVHLIDCAERQQSNLTIVDLQPADDTRAAGVPLFVHIRVKNQGSQTQRKVPIRVRTYAYDPQVVAAGKPGEDVSRQDEPPAVLIDEIAPGQSITARCQVYFPLPGPQIVEAQLPDDALATDNRRWCVIDLPQGEPVLIVDGGNTRPQHAYYVTSAFAPGQRAATGVQPDEVKLPAFLRDTTPDALRRYRAIYLLDVPRLDGRALENLTAYVRSGGGLGIFLGEQVNLAFYEQQFFADGAGLFPVPLDRHAELPTEQFGSTPDFEVVDHPIFQVFLGERNPLIRWVRIERYIRPPRDWSIGPDSPVAVLAKLRNGDPLAVERRFGEGRVVAFLTTAAPQWNNWANDPSFVVLMLKLQAYLAAPSRRTELRLTGSPIELHLPIDQFAQEVAFVTPGRGEGERLVIEKTAVPRREEALTAIASLRRTTPADEGPTDRSGVYEAWARALSGPTQVSRYAVNVDPNEGLLAQAEGAALLERLAPVKVEYHQADSYAYEFTDSAGANRSLVLMCLLIGALLSEQVLAYFTSFHPTRGVGR